MIDSVAYKDCVLCGSCVCICPVHAISFEAPVLDFKYPRIDFSKCVGCNKCEKVCPVIKDAAIQPTCAPEAVIARHRNSEIRKASTSGGIFSAAVEEILTKNGIICGAVFDENFKVRHICTESEDDIHKMMGSKYAQSDMGDCFSQIRSYLDHERLVLFTGCPCQVAGLRAFLGREYNNLILMEVVCHGIPSEQMLRSYIKLLETKKRSGLTALRFRDKSKGWHHSSVTAAFSSGGSYSKPYTADAYMRGFLGSTYLKESCYHCRFRAFRSGADLTVGDFWGAESEIPQFDDNTGLSAVLINTQKGKNFLQSLDIDSHPIDAETVICYNKNIMESPERSPDRDEFYRLAQKIGYSNAICKMFWEKTAAKLKREARYTARCVYYKMLGREKPLY
ncbi:MAG TPA: Coenzyme F420 hydrogenase/dehydrogenase, beta subunit C-terminal domain [Bacillota bacterium]|nr:Coenzyme F420 hydrogenase/dehydrogenase, beta subunit C-terminal domain [Bacillota bacterium]